MPSSSCFYLYTENLSLPVLHLRYNILQNVKNRYTDLRSCNHYTQYSHKILFMFSIFIGFAK